MPDFSKILSFGSPFLPIVSKTNFDNIARSQKIAQQTRLFAISIELCSIGIKHNEMHFEELSWISNDFQIGAVEIIDFFLGFTTLPILILGSEYLNKHDVQTTIKKICPPTKDPLEISVNQYKANTLIPLYLKLADIPQNQVSKKIVIAHEICSERPFSSNTYYLAGQTSAMITAQTLVTPPF